MAFRDGYGADEMHPGRWQFIQKDQERGVDVEFRVRPLGDDLQSDYDKRFGEPVFNPVTQTERYAIKPERNDEATKRMAQELWTDTRNAWIYLASKSAAEFYSRELGQTCHQGEEVCLDGRLTEAVKWNILKDDFPLAAQIVRVARRVQQNADRQREAMRKNSPASSRADSSGATPTSSAGDVGSSAESRTHASPIPT